MTTVPEQAVPKKIGIVYKGLIFQVVADGSIEGLATHIDPQKYPYTIVRKDVVGDEQEDFDRAVGEMIAEGADALFVIAVEPMNAALT